MSFALYLDKAFSKAFCFLKVSTSLEPSAFPLQTLPKFDVIIHLAGKAHDTKKQSAAQSYFDINTGLTQKIYDWFLTSEAKKFIFFSSVKAAADFVVGDKLTEEVIPTPNGPYGESKIAAENYILEQLKIENEELKMYIENNKVLVAKELSKLTGIAFDNHVGVNTLFDNLYKSFIDNGGLYREK